MRPRAVLLLLVLGTAACGGSSDPSGAPAADDPAPTGTWVLTEAEPTITVPDTTRITLTVESDDGELRAGGTAACNGYGGTLQLGGDTWVIEQLSWTEMACMDEGVMAAEAAYLEALPTVDSWQREDDRLRLTGPDVTLTYQRQPEPDPAALTGTTWEVDGYVSGTGDAAGVSSGTAGLPAPTVRFDDDGSVTITTACRGFTGTWSANGDRIELPELAATDPTSAGACEDAATTQERRVLGVLEPGPTAVVEGQRLTLRAGDVALLLGPSGGA